MDDEKIWKIIHSYFEDNPQCLVSHHIDSYNDFFQKGIFQIFKEKNPVTITSNYDENLGDFRNQCHLYMGGKDGSKIYFGKPVIYDDKDSHYMFPNEARLRNMTYGMTIHYDIDVEFVDILAEGEQPKMVLEEPETKGGYVYPRPQNGNTEENETESDYKIPQPFKNYKEVEGGGLDMKDEDDDSETEGGAPTKRTDGAPKKPRQVRPTKKTREKRTIKPFQMSPAATAALREAMEKSMIGPNTQRRTITIEKVYLGKFPIMLQSDFCILRGLDAQTRHTMGECRNDLGGYFIIQGLEKTVVTQEKFADNMLWVHAGKEHTDEDGKTEYTTDYMFSADIRSVSENVSKPIRNLSVQIVAPTKSYTNRNIVVNIPNVRKPVPLFILFRALGIVSDRSIIEMCLLDMEKYEHMIDLFVPSVHDAGAIMTQRLALEYIASLTKGKRVEHALEILADYFLPHIGEVNYNEKAYYLGYMVFRLLAVYTGLEPPTDRDNFKYKRMELVGSLMGELFREYYNLQLKAVQVAFEERLLFNKILYADNLPLLIQTFQDEVFKNRIVESGFTKAFKGNWGAQAHTKRVGIVQDLNRLSFNTYLSHLRKTNLPMPAGVKLVEPRKLHCSQWGYIDPIDTPDGGNIGLHKSLAITTTVTRGGRGLREPLVEWLREKISMKRVSECTPRMLADMTKVMINSYWAGSIMDPFDCMQKIKLYRRNALLPIFMSVTFDIKFNTIYIFTDAGRLCRPIFYKDETTKKMSFDNKEIRDLLEDPHSKISWENLVTGFNPKKGAKDVGGFDYRESRLYELSELYETKENNPAKLDRFITKKAVLDYIDCSESETALIALSYDQFLENPTKQYTHMEIHESLILGNMCNLIIFAENNPPTRNSFSCGQSKQAVSLYHTNHQVRMDKSAVVLNTGQIPLIKTRYLEHINREENTYGVNVIVAIMCFTGYNVEDAVLLNEGALARGLFRTTYYTTYQSHEESTKSGNATTDLKFTNIESENNVVGTKPGYDYSKLDKHGLIREETEVTDKTVLIGLTASSSDNAGVKQDQSKTAKKGQLGVVDKAFMTEGEEGERIAKVRVREVRIPNLGDKMASRHGQKGTVGLVIPERDMPFTKDGIRPDMIINPHAIPTRMTIGQLVETIMGKACVCLGAFGDGTPFINKGSKIGVFGELLPKLGFHSSGNEILYDGMSGQQIESEIFIGPTYYMRLKHMVKDKINYRALGPRTALTKQPVSGRANDGGLRIGEMERDAVAAHGITDFLTESMMERGDKYYMAVCNKTGLLAVYNPAKNLFFSPMADGPIKYIGSLDGKELHIENITKYGRDFSVVCVPYSLKLLIQELQAANIQMRIITEDNLPQLEGMSFSKNIENLMGLEMRDERGVENLTKDIKRRIQEDKLIDLAALNAPLMVGEPQVAEEESPFKILGEEEIEKLPEQIPGEESPPFTFEETPPEIRAELEAREKAKMEAEGEAKGGEPKQREYEIEDLVLYRGDPTKSWWKVIDKTSNFVTIQKAIVDDRVLPPIFMGGAADCAVEVVSHRDLYQWEDIPSGGNAPQMGEPVAMGGGEMPYMTNPIYNGGAGSQYHPQPVQIQPIINVIGGDNKGSIDIPAANPMPNPMMNNNGMGMMPQVATIVGGGGETQKEDSNGGGENLSSKKPLDFNNLMIKKVE